MSATKLRRVDHEPARMARRARMRTLRADAIAIATTAGADATIGMAAMATALPIHVSSGEAQLWSAQAEPSQCVGEPSAEIVERAGGGEQAEQADHMSV